MQTRDYLERMIRQIAEMLARVAGYTAEGRLDEAERELDATWSSALGFRRKDALRLDATSLRTLLGPKAEHAAALFDAEAKVMRARGDEARARYFESRARELTSGS